MSTPQDGQTHSNNMSAVANELNECVWPFCGLTLKGLIYVVPKYSKFHMTWDIINIYDPTLMKISSHILFNKLSPNGMGYCEYVLFIHSMYLYRVSTESWESWEIEQTVWKSHGIFFFFEKSWEVHGIFISCILENSIWLLLNTLLEVFVAESIKLTLFTNKD